MEETEIYETENLIFSHESLDLFKTTNWGHIHPGVSLMAQNRQN